MNHRILKQLNKCRIAKLPAYDENTTSLIIPRSGFNNTSPSDLELGKSYIVYIEDYVVHEPDGFTLSANWNSGTTPPENRLRVNITQIMGKMIRMNTTGCNTNITWSGWVPKKAISIIEEL